MKLVIDNRERDLIKVLTERGIVHVVEMLEIGDIVFRNDDDSIVLVIERKTVADLKASICDGRSREQKARLMNCGLDRSRIMFVIEGNIPKNLEDKIVGVTVSTILGSIINTQLRDRIHVHRTMSLTETCTFIEKLQQKLSVDIDKYFTSACSSGTDSGYAATLKTKKRDNVTPNVWFIQQLTMVPQVTEKIASIIIEKYPNVRELISTYESTEENLRCKLLSDLSYPIANNKTRRIGDKISERIFKLFYGLS